MNKPTTEFGAPVDDNDVSTAGRRGSMLLQDVWLLEKLTHFDREVVPERRRHAKGAGAFGTSGRSWRLKPDSFHAPIFVSTQVRRDIIDIDEEKPYA